MPIILAFYRKGRRIHEFEVIYSHTGMFKTSLGNMRPFPKKKERKETSAITCLINKSKALGLTLRKKGEVGDPSIMGRTPDKHPQDPMPSSGLLWYSHTGGIRSTHRY